MLIAPVLELVHNMKLGSRYPPQGSVDELAALPEASERPVDSPGSSFIDRSLAVVNRSLAHA
ncbi:MAG: hypothetical protein AB8E87_02810 [Prochlorococcus sp.]